MRRFSRGVCSWGISPNLSRSERQTDCNKLIHLIDSKSRLYKQKIWCIRSNICLEVGVKWEQSLSINSVSQYSIMWLWLYQSLEAKLCQRQNLLSIQPSFLYLQISVQVSKRMFRADGFLYTAPVCSCDFPQTVQRHVNQVNCKI